MTRMDRRAFLRNAAVVTAGVVAADQLELVERLGWSRRFFPGWSPARNEDWRLVETTPFDEFDHAVLTVSTGGYVTIEYHHKDGLSTRRYRLASSARARSLAQLGPTPDPRGAA